MSLKEKIIPKKTPQKQPRPSSPMQGKKKEIKKGATR